MFRKKYYILPCLIPATLILTALVYCKPSAPAIHHKSETVSASKPKIKRIATGLTVEPYVIKSKDSGFEVDIVREAFALEGYKVKFIYQPLKRTKLSFKNKLVDGVMTVKKHYPEIKGAFLSDNYITYHNFAVTLQSKKLKITSINDLSDKRTLGFQQASLALGPEFELMTQKNSRYREMADQKNQVAMFFMKRVDVIVLDHRIFKYHKNRLENYPTERPVNFHWIFEASIYRMAFREEDTRDSFNAGLKKLKKSGHYTKIINSYLDKNY